jgi:hypothetical protein
MLTIRFVVLVLGASLLASPVTAQTVGGRVAAGVFYASLPAGGQVHLRFALDSANTYDSDPIVVGPDAFVQREFVVPLLKVR